MHAPLFRMSLALVFCVALAACKTTTTAQYSVNISDDSSSNTILDTKLRKLEKMSKEYPRRADIPYQMAGVYFQKEAYRDSAKSLERAIYIEPNEAKYHYHLGRIHLIMRELPEAEAEFRKAIELTPPDRYTGPHGALGYVLCQQGRWKEAQAEYEKCVRIDPWDPNAYYYLGCIHDVQREREPAVENLRAYLRLGGYEFRTKAMEILASQGVTLTRQELAEADRAAAARRKAVESEVAAETDLFGPPGLPDDPARPGADAGKK